MINLNDILRSAQGGEAIEHLSARFGLTPEQTRSAVEALLPALRAGLQERAASGGLGALAANAETHRAAFRDPAAAGSAETAASGGAVTGDLFGGALTQIVQQAAQRSGVPAAVIQAMLPVITSMIVGGLLRGARSGAFGSVLGGLLGTLLGGDAGPAPREKAEQPDPRDGGLAGTLGGVLGGLFGGGEHAAPAPSAGAAADPAAAARAEISDLFEAGTPPAPEHEARLADLLKR